jgi:hypothetical protein
MHHICISSILTIRPGLDTASVLVKFATEQEAFDFYLRTLPFISIPPVYSCSLADRDFDALDLSSIHVKLTGFHCGTFPRFLLPDTH